jgi:DNA-binding MarR family transcriptional regulator
VPVEVPPTDTLPLDHLDREALIESLNQMTLPLMWAMRKEAQRTLEPLGIRPVTMLMLEALAQGIAAYPKDLAEVLDTGPSAVSALLADVEGQGLVQREIDPDDGRRVRLALTVKGERLRDDVRERWRGGDRRRVERLTDDDLRTLLRIYRTLLES